MVDDSTPALYQLASVFLLSLLAIQWYTKRGRPNLSSIPAVGYSSSLLSYITAVRYIWDSQNLINEGYRKRRGGLFKIPMLDHWIVVATDVQSVEDIRKAPEDVLSVQRAQELFMQSDYTVGPEMRLYPYHTGLIRTELTRSLTELSDLLYDDQLQSFNKLVPVKDEWISRDVKKVFVQIVCRTSNRIFVGLPLCRDPDYINLNIIFTLELVKAAVAIKPFPTFLKPLASYVFSNVRSCTRQCIKHVGPIIEERRAQQKEFGKQWEKPNDMLMWCMDTAESLGNEKDIDKLALRILLINFGAIHTTSLTLVWAVYYLAAYPEYVPLLREEVETVITRDGWSKPGLNKLRRIDSFLRETLRSMQRYCIKPFTFSGGYAVPAGTVVSCPVMSMQGDEAFYEDAQEFRPWRFYDMRNREGKGHKNSFPSTNPEYIAFGHGKLACPGRFFAAYELRAMVAHIIMTYDVKFEDGKTKPPNVYIDSACLPGEANVLFKRRAGGG